MMERGEGGETHECCKYQRRNGIRRFPMTRAVVALSSVFAPPCCSCFFYSLVLRTWYHDACATFSILGRIPFVSVAISNDIGGYYESMDEILGEWVRFVTLTPPSLRIS